MFEATWFAGDNAIASETAGSYAATRDIARSRLSAHRQAAGATRVEVRSDEGELVFDSREGFVPAAVRRPSLSAGHVKRWAMPNTTPA